VPTNYTGDPTATEAPSATPEPEGFPVVALPADGDPPNASTFAQGFKVLADFIGWLQKPRAKASAWAQAIMRYRSAGLHTRFAVDHLGFPAGKFLSWYEWWPYVFNLLPAVPASYSDYLIDNWTGVIEALSGAPRILDAAPSASVFPHSGGVELRQGDQATDYTYLIRKPVCLFTTANHAAMDWDILVDDATIATVCFAGLVTDPGAGSPLTTATGLAWFWKDYGAGNWFCQTKDGTTLNNQDSGVAATSTITRLRIEWHGSGVSDDATSRVLFFIDGTLVQNITVNLPITDAVQYVRPIFGVSGTGTEPTTSMYVGPVRFSSSLYDADVLF